MQRLGFAATLGLLVLGQTLLFATVYVFVGITMVAHGVDVATAQRTVTTDPLALGASQLAALGAVIALGTWLGTPGRVPSVALGVQPASPRVVALAAVVGLALQLPMVELTTLLVRAVPSIAHTPAMDASLEALTRISTPLRALTVPFAFVVIAPVTEELLFRGLLLRSLRERHGAPVAIGVTAVLFGVYHFDPSALPYATIVGLLLGVLAHRSGSTLPGIAMHAGFNAAPIVVPQEVLRIPGFNTAPTADVPWPFLVTSTAVALVAGVALAWTLRKTPDPG